MDYIWSPWRMKYILDKEQSPDCVFCFAAQQPQSEDAANLVLYRGKDAFVMLNRFPYTSGHLMVLPYEHRSSYEEVAAAVRAEMMELINMVTRLLRDVYQPHGFNVGANIGADAGAGIADHLHFHIVPRWRGDSNFMSVTAHTRVLPEDLAESYLRLKEGLPAAHLPANAARNHDR